tara:strand:+ start:9183 stop:9725 length:543 start_codon:yes stop_codon:yes gene_type:complete
MNTEHHHQQSPPKAEVTGSNPVGCTNTNQSLSGNLEADKTAYICDLSQKRTILPKENAASEATDNGAISIVAHKNQLDNDTPNQAHFTSEYVADLTERAQRAYDALSDLEPWQAEMVAAKVLKESGGPLPAFLGGMDDARFWASIASPAEIDCYAAACIEMMHPKRLTALLDYGQRRAAA